MNLSEKIISKHLVSGKMEIGNEIGLTIDQTLTQDATGTMAYLQFEAMGISKVKTKLSVSYVDHNTLQTGFENADDHRYLQSVADKYGIQFSPAGNGICHQLHLEKFGVPGQTLIGSDSHTPTAGGLGMLAFGAGGLDVACAMAGEPFFITMPKIVRVTLTGSLSTWVSAKDIILELLRRLSVKGGRGKIFEFSGPGVETLSVPERATITNMGTELGATTTIFPSDENTHSFLKQQKRPDSYKPLCADKNADYDEEIEIDLTTLEPLIALPHSPDNIKKVSEVEGIKVQQVAIGSCTNSSLADMILVSQVLRTRRVHPDVSLVVSPGSKSVVLALIQTGALPGIISGGARLLECSCGPCIGMGQSPSSGAVSLRTFNRNFEGRSGTKDAQVYLCSPETAVAAAVTGKITDPRKLKKQNSTQHMIGVALNENRLIAPTDKPEEVTIVRGPNIKPLPEFDALPETIKASVVIKLGDNISTDHILPAGAKILPLRSNLPAISEYVFGAVDKNFIKRTKEAEGGIIVAGENYGQGSSREHAALAPRYLGIKAVIVKSFARIHLANLINFGILPLTFKNPADYSFILIDNVINIKNVAKLIKSNKSEIIAGIYSKAGGLKKEIPLCCTLTPRQKDILLAGGLLNYIKQR